MEELWCMTSDNSPDSMARSIAKAVIRPNHAGIARNVRFVVEKQFIYAKTVNSNSSPLDGLGGNG
jgi:hypothetical protein